MRNNGCISEMNESRVWCLESTFIQTKLCARFITGSIGYFHFCNAHRYRMVCKNTSCNKPCPVFPVLSLHNIPRYIRSPPLLFSPRLIQRSYLTFRLRSLVQGTACFLATCLMFALERKRERGRVITRCALLASRIVSDKYLEVF